MPHPRPTLDVLVAELESKTRHVRTEEGSHRYNLPIGAPITRAAVEAARSRGGHGGSGSSGSGSTSRPSGRNRSGRGIASEGDRSGANAPRNPGTIVLGRGESISLVTGRVTRADGTTRETHTPTRNASSHTVRNDSGTTTVVPRNRSGSNTTTSTPRNRNGSSGGGSSTPSRSDSTTPRSGGSSTTVPRNRNGREQIDQRPISERVPERTPSGGESHASEATKNRTTRVDNVTGKNGGPIKAGDRVSYQGRSRKVSEVRKANDGGDDMVIFEDAPTGTGGRSRLREAPAKKVSENSSSSDSSSRGNSDSNSGSGDNSSSNTPSSNSQTGDSTTSVPRQRSSRARDRAFGGGTPAPANGDQSNDQSNNQGGTGNQSTQRQNGGQRSGGGGGKGGAFSGLIALIQAIIRLIQARQNRNQQSTSTTTPQSTTSTASLEDWLEEKALAEQFGVEIGDVQFFVDAVKAGRLKKFDPHKHPRDKHGKFIKTGQIVDLPDGGKGRVVGVSKGGSVVTTDVSTGKRSTHTADKLAISNEKASVPKGKGGQEIGVGSEVVDHNGKRRDVTSISENDGGGHTITTQAHGDANDVGTHAPADLTPSITNSRGETVKVGDRVTTDTGGVGTVRSVHPEDGVARVAVDGSKWTRVKYRADRLTPAKTEPDKPEGLTELDTPLGKVRVGSAVEHVRADGTRVSGDVTAINADRSLQVQHHGTGQDEHVELSRLAAVHPPVGETPPEPDVPPTPEVEPKTASTPWGDVSVGDKVTYRAVDRSTRTGTVSRISDDGTMYVNHGDGLSGYAKPSQLTAVEGRDLPTVDAATKRNMISGDSVTFRADDGTVKTGTIKDVRGTRVSINTPPGTEGGGLPGFHQIEDTEVISHEPDMTQPRPDRARVVGANWTAPGIGKLTVTKVNDDGTVQVAAEQYGGREITYDPRGIAPATTVNPPAPDRTPPEPLHDFEPGEKVRVDVKGNPTDATFVRDTGTGLEVRLPSGDVEEHKYDAVQRPPHIQAVRDARNAFNDGQIGGDGKPLPLGFVQSKGQEADWAGKQAGTQRLLADVIDPETSPGTLDVAPLNTTIGGEAAINKALDSLKGERVRRINAAEPADDIPDVWTQPHQWTPAQRATMARTLRSQAEQNQAKYDAAPYQKVGVNRENGESPAIVEVAADGGPGERTVKLLAAQQNAGRAIDEEANRRIDARMGDNQQKLERINAQVADAEEAHNAAIRDYNEKYRKLMADPAFINGTIDERRRMRDQLRESRETNLPEMTALREQQRELKVQQKTIARDERLAVLQEIRLFGAPPGVDGVRVVNNRGGDLTGRHKGQKAVRYAEKHYPADWVQKSTDASKNRPMVLATSSRGWYSERGKTGLPEMRIGYDSYDSSGFTDAPEGDNVTLHEYGHRMEGLITGLTASEWAYHWQRTTDDPSQPPGRRTRRSTENVLRPLGGIYKSSEKGRRDTYPEKYTGKEYNRGTVAAQQNYEIFTTSVESVFGKSEYTDEGLRQWTLGALAVL